MIKSQSKLNKNLNTFWEAGKQPILATIFGLIIGGFVILLSGGNPISVYTNMFQKSFFQTYYLLQTFTRSSPIMVCAIATAVAWRAGYINIGVEGQMIVGGFVATVCAIYMPGPPVIVMVVSILAGMLAGGLYAVIAALLYIKYNVSLVITTLMMNYIASFVTSYYVSFPLRDLSGDGIASQSVLIDEGVRFLSFSSKNTFNVAFFMAIAVVFIFKYASDNTVFGYESKMTGLNPHFARYGGVKQVKTVLITMAISGGIAAFAGVCEIYGVKYRFIDGMFTTTSYAWTGLMAALIAGLNPIGIMISSIFLSGLQVGGQAIQRVSNIPLEMSTLIQCAITLFVSVKIVFKSKISKKSIDELRIQKEEGGGV